MQVLACGESDSAVAVETHLIPDDGVVPNNRLPLVVYRGVLPDSRDRASACEEMFARNGWPDAWRNGIYGHHHYHSTAHEALLVYGGSAKVQLGGESGNIETIGVGDVIVIPAGVGHKNLGSSSDFHVVGAYPPQQNVDMNYGKPGERPRVDENIARLALPLLGVVTGREADALELADGQRISPYALTVALESVADVRQYQVVQRDRAHLEVRVESIARDWFVTAAKR